MKGTGVAKDSLCEALPSRLLIIELPDGAEVGHLLRGPWRLPSIRLAFLRCSPTSPPEPHGPAQARLQS